MVGNPSASQVLNLDIVLPVRDRESLKALAAAHRPTALAVGNGTAGRETQEFIEGLGLGLPLVGGSLRQLFGLGVFTPQGTGQNCQSGTDANPAPGATIFAGRLTTPLFGLGLVDLFEGAGHQDEADLLEVVQLVDGAFDFEGRFARKRHVDEDDVGAEEGDLLEGVVAIGDRLDLVTLIGERKADHLLNRQTVVRY